MSTWVCDICGFRHLAHDASCMGCGHTGSMLREWRDCPKCGNESVPDATSCGHCYASLDPEPLEWDEDEDEDREDDEDDDLGDDDMTEEY